MTRLCLAPKYRVAARWHVPLPFAGQRLRRQATSQRGCAPLFVRSPVVRLLRVVQEDENHPSIHDPRGCASTNAGPPQSTSTRRHNPTCVLPPQRSSATTPKPVAPGYQSIRHSPCIMTQFRKRHSPACHPSRPNTPNPCAASSVLFRLPPRHHILLPGPPPIRAVQTSRSGPNQRPAWQ